MGLQEFSAKTKTCKIELVGGRLAELIFRPFTLGDIAWLEDEFPTQEDQLAIAGLKSTHVCKIIWHQLTAESKSFFSEIKFIMYNEDTGKDETVDAVGYEKILHAFKNQENMIKAFAAYSEVEGLNNFIPDEKKKTVRMAA